MKAAFEVLKKEVNARGFGVAAHSALVRLFRVCAAIVNADSTTELVSKVEGKTYFAFSNSPKALSRAINQELFVSDAGHVEIVLRDLLAGLREIWSAQEITRVIYTVAITCCAARDLTGGVTVLL